MINKIWKTKAYSNTKVNYIKSQSVIDKLLRNNGINEMQFTNQSNVTSITFLKDLIVENNKLKVGVKITLPNITDKNRNQLYRALFYYLKAKFESLSFGFVEEYNEAFVKEFMPYLIADKQGRTVADLILPKFQNALNYTKSGEQLFIENKNEKES